MAENSKIQWTDHSGNPWIGCTKKKLKSGRMRRGCAHCYAELMDKNRFSKTLGGATKEAPIIHWGEGASRHYRLESLAKEAKRWNDQPLIWDGTKHRRAFVFPSLCDWLDEEVPAEKRAAFLRIILDTPNLIWLLLSKRPENFFVLLNEIQAKFYRDQSLWEFANNWLVGQPPHNVYVGASCEDQGSADETIPDLLKIPAKVRFLSVEPMCGPILFPWQFSLIDRNACGLEDDPLAATLLQQAVDEGRGSAPMMVEMVIFGGESGPKAGPCNIEWIRDGIRQCRAAGGRVFVKQLGSDPICSDHTKPFVIRDPKGGDPSEWPEDLRIREDWPV